MTGANAPDEERVNCIDNNIWAFPTFTEDSLKKRFRLGDRFMRRQEQYAKKLRALYCGAVMFRMSSNALELIVQYPTTKSLVEGFMNLK